jgi:BlaI family transcriptional regulator, penicillinase repressor
MGMAPANVSEAELEVLKALWEHGPGTVRQTSARLRGRKRRWAYNTVLTLLSRLREKGYITSEKGRVAHVFAAAVSREELLRRRLTELADQVCDGTASPLVHALVQGQRFSPDEIAGFRKLLDELEPEE